MKLKLTSPQILALGFLAVILTGSVLLMLPVSNTNGCSFIDALFTSTSAVCVTGLIVKDTPVDFTLFGHIVIMLLIQIGGLGYMTSATIIFLMTGKNIGITERIAIKEGLNVETVEGIVRFIKKVALFTAVIELAGALVLTTRFLREYPLSDAFLYGLFHAVSAFNNAGFSLFSDNLIRYRGDITVNLTITTLVIVGGIGFIVMMDIHKFIRKEVTRLTQHSKIVLLSTAILIMTGAILIFLMEYSNSGTFGIFPLKEKILVSYFSSVTARTAGFNTIDYSLLHTETLFLTITLMFIGASPGSTGGGVKTSTIAVIVASLYATIRGKKDTVLFKRRVPSDIVTRAFLLMTLAVFFCTFVNHFIISTQDTQYLPSVFEVTSAFGTVGLSVGDGGTRSFAALFTSFGKFILVCTMFVGRLGPLTFAVAMTRQVKERFRYPEGKVIIG
ncbi:MAG: TrkH family potassium uptake protein [Thermodesulfovibrionales bacterium]|nr:TrkH family potassium uptake protein [Thermodesulfovibrionales bacterium]